MEQLLKSRKFWLLILDTAIALILFGVGIFAPEQQDNAEKLIAMLQPVFMMIIGAIAYEDGQEKRAGVVLEADPKE